MTPLLAYGIGLALTLVLACHATPARWWRRPTLRAAACLGAGTAALGAGLLALATPPDPGARLPVAAPPMPATAAAAPAPLYLTRQALNLRAARGVGAARIAVLPAATPVQRTGRRDGDWWEVTATVNGRALRGWASSLWLRRPGEAGP